eukprot:scaffold111951_cov54-Attheya_sp.AAC.5
MPEQHKSNLNRLGILTDHARNFLRGSPHYLLDRINRASAPAGHVAFNSDLLLDLISNAYVRNCHDRHSTSSVAYCIKHVPYGNVR